MPDRPILFSGPMIRALLVGRKTQTRRVLKPWPGYQSEWLTMDVLHRAPTCYLAVVDGDFGVQMQHPLAGQTIDGIENDNMSPLTWVRLPYAPGDRLYVRERFIICDECGHLNHADGANSAGINDRKACASCDEMLPKRNRPGIHMPRANSRLTLIVTDVRVQRLQEISGYDAVAEGACEFGLVPPLDKDLEEAVGHFRDLWDSLNAKRGYGWAVNPWVCAVSFTVHRQNIDQMEAT